MFSSCDSPVGDVESNNQSLSKAENLLSEIPSNALPEQADSLRKVIWQQFREQNGTDWKVTWSEKTGLPLTVFSGTTEPVAGTPEQAAQTFLAQNRSLFGMRGDLADLKLIEVDLSPRGNRHVRFQQTYKGVSVYEATWQVHLRPDGRIDMANGHYYPDIEVSTQPAVSASSATQTAVADLGVQTALKEDPETELMIVRNPETDAFALAWRIAISEKGLHWQYFIDAANGQVLEKLELVTSITGDGDVILETTCTTPNPANRDLFRLFGNGYLEGTYANVYNEETSRAFSSVNSFQYATDNTHFEEVNVYYHIDTYRHNYLNTIGFAGENIGSDQDLEAFVHDPVYLAAYIFSQEAVRFGDPPDFALQDEVVYHEFVHAAADAINGSHRLDPNDNEEGAIGEGTSDYFAGSFTGDTQTGVCVLAEPRDKENPDIAHYNNLLRDNEGNVIEPMHNGGEFFSAVLWDLRNDGGISVQEADEIIFEAIRRLSGAPDFMEYRDAMMAVDDDVNGGVNNNLIQDTFYFRGIGSYSLDPEISGPGLVNETDTETWTASVSGGLSPYSGHTWYKRDDPSDSWLGVGSGSSYQETISSGSDFQLRVCVTDDRSISRCSSAFQVFVH